MEPVHSFSEKRLARLFRQAGLHQIRHEYGPALRALETAAFVLEWSSLADEAVSHRHALAERFVREWADALTREREGHSLDAAPAAWIHLSQELAAQLEAGEDWLAYLERRWTVDAGTLSLSRRCAYGALSCLALGMSAMLAALLVRHAAAGEWGWLTAGGQKSGLAAFVFVLSRVAGLVLMVERGWLWGVRAFRGRADRPCVLFLGSPEGLVIVAETPQA